MLPSEWRSAFGKDLDPAGVGSSDSRRNRRMDEKFRRNSVALSVSPCLDRIEVAGSDTCPGAGIKARPGQRDGATDKCRIAGLVRVGVVQRRRDATMLDHIKMRRETKSR